MEPDGGGDREGLMKGQGVEGWVEGRRDERREDRMKGCMEEQRWMDEGVEGWKVENRIRDAEIEGGTEGGWGDGRMGGWIVDCVGGRVGGWMEGQMVDWMGGWGAGG